MAAPRKIVRLYALSTCPYCIRVKNFLRDRKVEFELTEVDLLEDSEKWAVAKEVKRHNPNATYPTLIIEKVFTEFDEKAIVEALEN